MVFDQLQKVDYPHQKDTEKDSSEMGIFLNLEGENVEVFDDF